MSKLLSFAERSRFQRRYIELKIYFVLKPVYRTNHNFEGKPEIVVIQILTGNYFFVVKSITIFKNIFNCFYKIPRNYFNFVSPLYMTKYFSAVFQDLNNLCKTLICIESHTFERKCKFEINPKMLIKYKVLCKKFLVNNFNY